MAENPSSRQIAKDLLQGVAPPRSLFLPILFALGARVENLPAPVFLKNPTRICNALRQIRARFPTDGVSCYFDPYLEVEALGATLRWSGDAQPPSVCWPDGQSQGELPPGLRSPEDAVKAGRIPIATEVVRRLAALLRDDALLMAGVSGPFTLAAQLVQIPEQEPDVESWPAAALEIAAVMLSQTAAALAEAGAHVILIHEASLPRLSPESCDSWATLLSPAFNLIRFYGALPVLLLADPAAHARNLDLILSREWQGILCPALGASSLMSAGANDMSKRGIALPLDLFSQDKSGAELVRCIKDLRPALITTADNIPASADIKRLGEIFEEVRR